MTDKTYKIDVCQSVTKFDGLTPQGGDATPVAKKGAKNSKAIEVAQYLIHLAAAEEEPEYLTHLRLQKLLYFAQGWSLVMRKKALFSERIEAWSHGPVVPIVYQEFKYQGHLPIDPDRIAQPVSLTTDEKSFVVSLWQEYKKFSASKLRQLTHEHEPWINARDGKKPEESCSNEITQAAMKSAFEKML